MALESVDGVCPNGCTVSAYIDFATDTERPAYCIGNPNCQVYFQVADQYINPGLGEWTFECLEVKQTEPTNGDRSRRRTS